MAVRPGPAAAPFMRAGMTQQNFHLSREMVF
jgi:hypothetical protein